LYIEKIRPIDKQLSYQVEKLLRVTAKVQKDATAEAAAAAAAAAAAGDEQAAAADGGDALQYRPNPQALISKVPLVGDTTGEGGGEGYWCGRGGALVWWSLLL
jgi:U3 small nucleolar RNA-associated protein 3